MPSPAFPVSGAACGEMGQGAPRSGLRMLCTCRTGCRSTCSSFDAFTCTSPCITDNAPTHTHCNLLCCRHCLHTLRPRHTHAHTTAVLQDSVKLTNQPPRGVRASLERAFNDLGHEVRRCSNRWRSAARAVTAASAPLPGLATGCREAAAADDAHVHAQTAQMCPPRRVRATGDGGVPGQACGVAARAVLADAVPRSGAGARGPLTSVCAAC